MTNVQKSNFIGQPEFYLGYLRGSAPTPNFYHYSIQVTISEKSSRRYEVSAQSLTFLKIVSQNAPDCISAHNLKKISRGACLRLPKEACGIRPLGTSPPNDKSQIEPYSPPVSNQAKKARYFVTASNNVKAQVRVPSLYLFMDVSPTSNFANNLFAKRLKSFRQHVRLVSYISPDHQLKGKGGQYVCIGLFRVIAEEQGIFT